jgi:hypothetical protein
MGEAIINILIILVLGGGAFYWGFTRLIRKRLIENTPTSTARGLAMGLVELVGLAKPKLPLKSPFMDLDCVFFRYTIERWQNSGRSGKWVKISQGDSFFVPFYVEDNTGRAAIAPKGAELIMPVDYEFITGWGKDLPANLIMFMAKYNLQTGGMFGQYKLRFREWCIYPNQPVYVLGVAKKSADFIGGHKEKILEHLRELKKDPVKMAEADTDKDGQISVAEWETVRQKIEQEVLEQEIKSPGLSEMSDVLIGKGETEKTFIISDKSQKELISRLFWQSLAGVYGGGALLLGAVVFLLVRLGVVKF